MKNTTALILSGMLALGAANAAWACGGHKNAEKASTTTTKVETAQVLPVSDVKVVDAKAGSGCAMKADKAAMADCPASPACPGDMKGASASQTATTAPAPSVNAETVASEKGCCPSEAEKAEVKAVAPAQPETKKAS